MNPYKHIVLHEPLFHADKGLKAPHTLYIAALAMIAALSSASRTSAPQHRQSKAARGEGWRPAGAEARRRRTRREEEEPEFEVEGLSDEYSDSEEEDVEEQPLRFPQDPSRDETEELEKFLTSYFEKYPRDSNTRTLKGVEGAEVTVSKQFRRDLPTMIRVNGKKADGEDDDSRTVFAYQVIKQAAEGLKPKKKGAKRSPEDIMGIANQNLGIYLYESIVKRYEVEDKSVSVMQAGHHYIDITTADNGLSVGLVAYFKLHNADNLEIQPWLIQSSILVDLREAKVKISYSKPVQSPSDPQTSLQALDQLKDDTRDSGFQGSAYGP
mmetsp:Transcript_5031/g.8094  ORF Transcript_5031/g.8094 Transcript_5031/m.8094 type:complete len:325 (-) Transcript_5031:49-1023(-)